MSRDLSRRLNFKIDEAQLARLDKAAARLGLDRSEIARRCLNESLPKFERVRRLPGSPPEQTELESR